LLEVEKMNYQTIVLSGGGAKGPYGLGVLLALQRYHRERNWDIEKIYCGTSVGALNATLAAQGDLSQLTKLYSEIRTKDILGVSESRLKKLRMLRVVGRKPFRYFENAALKSTIEKYAKFDQLRDAHLLICATNYSTGDLETFYISSLIDEFLQLEQSHPPEMHRLLGYHPITSQQELVQALLASTAIPFYLPPVKIGKSLYVDGGVGNNTPLKQAAYISRFLSCRDGTVLQPTLCVINDPSRFRISPEEFGDAFGVIRRTMDIYHNELVSDSYLSWDRINKEVRRGEDRENLLISRILGLPGVAADKQAELVKFVRESSSTTSTSTRRCHLPLMVVRPATPLLEDILHFDPAAARRLKEHGVADYLTLLANKDHISVPNQRRWIEEID
jgi:Patatin-like phospholipase